MNLYEIVMLPQLKVLALGQYVFTDERQTDWIATIGERNASGGLEELYLDECPILFKAHQHSPLTSDEYLDPRATLKGNYATSVTKEYNIRRHNVLETWRGRMEGLKKFIMGHGDWSSQWPSTKTLIEYEGFVNLNSDDLSPMFSENVHRNFCKPAGVEVSNTKDPVLAQRYLMARDCYNEGQHECSISSIIPACAGHGIIHIRPGEEVDQTMVGHQRRRLSECMMRRTSYSWQLVGTGF